MSVREGNWQEIKLQANNILGGYRANSKDTYDNFYAWTQEDQEFIRELSDVLGYAKYEKLSNKYINNFMKIILAANDMFKRYNKPKETSREKLLAYETCIDYLLHHEDEYNFTHLSEWQSKLTKRYKSYRGMATLSDYTGNLEHPKLLERTVQLIRTDLLHDFINNPENNIEKEWGNLVKENKGQLELVFA